MSKRFTHVEIGMGADSGFEMDFVSCRAEGKSFTPVNPFSDLGTSGGSTGPRHFSTRKSEWEVRYGSDYCSTSFLGKSNRTYLAVKFSL